MRSRATNGFPITAALATVFASVGAAALVASWIVSGSPSLETNSVSINQFEELVVRLDRLEQRSVNPELDDQPGPNEPLIEDRTSDQESSNLEQRIARLENIEADRRAAAEMRAEQRRQQMQQIAAAATAIMLNPSAEDQAKIQAWGQIRMNAADAWTDEIVAEAVRIGTTSTDPQIRANVWRQAHAGRTHPLLLQPLLNALANEPERSAREEAAETLDLYLDEPGVREALQIASQYDPDPGVRSQAMTSLAGPQGGY